MKKLTIVILISQILSHDSMAAVSREQSSQSSKLRPVIVTYAMTKETPTSALQLDQQTLDKAVSDSPGDLFRHVPGVAFQKDPFAGGLGGIRIRGMGGSTEFNSDRVAINIDGVPVPDSYKFGHIENNGQNTFDIADLKTAEIYKGAGLTGVAGRSGLAGTVNLTTKDPADYLEDGEHFGGNVRSGYSGENEMFKNGFSLAGQFSDQVSTMFSYTRRDYHETPNYDGAYLSGKERLALNPVNAESHNILGKIVFSPNDRHTFKLKLESYKLHFDEEMLNHTSAYLFRDKIKQQDETYWNKFKSDRQQLSLKHEFNIRTPLFDSGDWQFYYQDSKQKRDDDYVSYSKKHQGIRSGKTSYKTKELGFHANFDKEIFNHQLGYGFSLRRLNAMSWDQYASKSDGDISPYVHQPDTKTESQRLYIDDDWSLANGRFHLLPGLGVTHYTLTPKKTPNYHDKMTKNAHTVPTWSLGTTFNITEDQQIFASYRRGIKLPSFLEYGIGKLFAHSSTPYKPNHDLKPERSQSVELGLKSKGTWGSSTISLFHDTYQDFLNTRTIDGGKYRQAYNTPDEVTIYGVEVNGLLDLSQSMLDGLKVKGALAYAKSREKTEDGKQPYTNGDPLMASLGLVYDSPSDKWGLEWTSRFAKAKKAGDIAPDDLNPSEWWNVPVDPIAGYGVSDFSAYFKPIKNMLITAGVYNVFDKKYAVWSQSIKEDYDQITEPGRTFAVNLRYDF